MATDKIKKRDDVASNNGFTFVFGKVNYILLGVGLALLALGYILLSGGGSDDSAVFNPDMFDNRRLVAAPICIIVGFIVEIFAIMLKPKNDKA
ncbi:MAG: DUF3098 domain-containing protein [Bacteroidales bacterium]|nr:DUF3098 domain-containing protein [Bacteroidales bacterium]